MEGGVRGKLRADLVRIEEALADTEPSEADPKGRILAAVAVVLAPGPDEGLDLLLIKRTERSDDPWSGQMALPGGRMEAIDDSLLETAVRETREETDVVLDRSLLLGRLDDLSPITPHLPPILVRPFVFGLTRRPPVTYSEEVALHLWVPLRDFADSRVTEPLVIRGLHIQADGFRFGPHLVWGMTARILEPFLDLL